MTLPNDIHEQVNVSEIRAGDTVLINGVLKTVCQKNLGKGDMMGATLWGDSFRLGRDLVTRVTFGAEIERRKAN